MEWSEHGRERQEVKKEGKEWRERITWSIRSQGKNFAFMPVGFEQMSALI